MRRPLNEVRLRRLLLRSWITFVTAAIAEGTFPGNTQASVVQPELRLEERYDDNTGSAEHGAGDLVRVITPKLGVARLGSVTNWQMWASRSFLSYSKSIPSPITTDRASFRVDRASSDVSSARLTLQGIRSRNDSEPDRPSAIGLGRYRNGTARASFALRHLEGFGEAQTWDYGGEELSDAIAQRLDLSLVPIRYRTQSWLLSYWGQRQDVVGRWRLKSQAVAAGFRRHHSRQLTSEWHVGVAEVGEDAVAPKARRLAFGVGVVLGGAAPGEEPRVEVALRRDAVTSAVGIVRKQLPIGAATAKWESGIRTKGAYHQTSTLERRASFGITRVLGASVTVAGEGSYQWGRPYHASGSLEETYRAGVTFSAPIASWASGRVMYDYVYERDPNRPEPLNYRRGRVAVSLTAGVLQ